MNILVAASQTLVGLFVDDGSLAMRATMMFDTECKAANDPDGEERLAMEAVRARQAAATTR